MIIKSSKLKLEGIHSIEDVKSYVFVKSGMYLRYGHRCIVFALYLHMIQRQMSRFLLWTSFRWHSTQQCFVQFCSVTITCMHIQNSPQAVHSPHDLHNRILQFFLISDDLFKLNVEEDALTNYVINSWSRNTIQAWINSWELPSFLCLQWKSDNCSYENELSATDMLKISTCISQCNSLNS